MISKKSGSYRPGRFAPIFNFSGSFCPDFFVKGVLLSYSKCFRFFHGSFKILRECNNYWNIYFDIFVPAKWVINIIRLISLTHQRQSNVICPSCKTVITLYFVNHFWLTLDQVNWNWLDYDRFCNAFFFIIYYIDLLFNTLKTSFYELFVTRTYFKI